MEDTNGDALIAATYELHKKYNNLLNLCHRDPSEENWNRAYIANQAWVDGVNKLKDHNISLRIKISDQFRF